ncbi:polyribonucleotide nucleotidyltransferase [Desulfovibrio litoralis]|uniref:Polyribonucleotide nucleotidyltransferase n=1 Tax=Desulfovibrio litoralis DSM 11393 TaxID=1121455 RepID=A0A1M7TJW5_9BACT|nr:polyribonucleotide nucleotidyltransferase [Desulfovibrio litoralis]SHN71039.1 polyribonucleotide nucleotidyltransferase [Desulfovibrio litoralis DSM 11393]
MSNVFDCQRVNVMVGGKEIILETGRIANQANGSIWIQCGGTVVMVTACSQAMERDMGFFPLTVEYAERMYAAGRIPGSFFRREIGRPSERETLVSRLIDRPIRPLFPKGLKQEVQVLATVISADQENESDVLSIAGASVALGLSSIPFAGPVAGARIGRVNGTYVLNPTVQELEKSDMNIVFAASKDAVVMVEGEAKFISEDTFLEALNWGHKEIQPLLLAQEELVAKAGKVKAATPEIIENVALAEKVSNIIKTDLSAALQVPAKLERKEVRKAVKEKLVAALNEDPEILDKPELMAEALEELGNLEKKIVRERILKEGKRIDGRDTKTVRPILIEPSALPRAHGSVIFSRGETKSLVVTTLGSATDEQRMDSLNGDYVKRFMLHYNFPPFSVGEVKPVRVSRREIGHGALAEKALRQILPSEESFPFTLRIVSETLESNGSSSMAAVCGGTLSLMDAGVPISAPVAGIAMGLIKEGSEYIILTDILGDEDALGDMDFKIAGTRDGITAVQMDIKISGIPTEVMGKALNQAKDARLHILGEMLKALPASRGELSQYAPQHCEVSVSPDVIRLIIGPGGKNIKEITAKTGASVDIDDSGKVAIFAPTQDALNIAKAMVLAFDQKAELGKDYGAKVKKVLEIGVVVELMPNLEALVHVSQLDTSRVENVADFAKVGDEMTVKVVEISGDRVRASRKAVLLEAEGQVWKPEDTARPQRERSGGYRDGGDRGRRDGGGRGDSRGGYQKR